ncbi:MAG: hypothetical protein HY302_12935 [Opitutae bacterium]|nr:hypothetical protein [Opitutae bacterium]
MVFAELKPQIEKLPRPEQRKALAFLKHLLREGTAENRTDLARRHTEIEAGRKISHEELKARLGLT